MLGQTVLQGIRIKEINVSSLKEGIYFLEVSEGENTVSKKFIKQ